MKQVIKSVLVEYVYISENGMSGRVYFLDKTVFKKMFQKYIFGNVIFKVCNLIGSRSPEA